MQTKTFIALAALALVGGAPAAPQPAAAPSAPAAAAQESPAMRSGANAAGERLALCYESPKEGWATYALHLERATGEKLRCICRGGEGFRYLALPERLQWVEGTQKLALLHFRDGERSSLHVIDIFSDDVVEEDGEVKGTWGYADLLAEDKECSQLYLRGKEADWRRADGSLVATFHLDSPKEEGWSAGHLADTRVGSLHFASAPNGRGERVGLRFRKGNGRSCFGRFSLMQPGKEARDIHPLYGMDGLVIEEEQGQSPFGWGIRLGWVGDDSFYASQCWKHGSYFDIIRLQRAPQGAVELGRTGLEVISGGRHYCAEEGASLILRAEDGSKIMTVPLK